MWKRGETEELGAKPSAATSTAASGRPGQKREGPATIGPSIHIKGDVTGSEDLVIQGRVDGSVDLAQNHVTVGSEGRVKADVSARTVTVEGEVEGDLSAHEQITLRRSARVQGNISAPRVSLEDGAVFRGGIDMQDKAPAVNSRGAAPAGGRDRINAKSPVNSSGDAPKS
jgi:cytoskeletal protein CcmA (bactofilin family)